VPIHLLVRAVPAAVDPAVEERLAEARRRLPRNPIGREWRIRLLFAVFFLASALALALASETQRDPAPWMIFAFVLAYAVSASIGFDLGPGQALPTELVFVPMLFLLPPGWVPLVVASGLFVAASREVLAGSLSWRRAIVWPPANSIFALGPAVVFVLAGEPEADARGGAVLLLALVVQFVVDACASCTLEWLANGVPPRELLGPLRWTFAIDALLAPLGYLAALGARLEPIAIFLPISVVGLLAFFAHERRARLNSALELSAAYRGTALLLGDIVEADDAYTGDHSRQVYELVMQVVGRLELDPSMRRLAEFGALLHDVGKIRIPAEIIGKPGPLTAEERAIVNTHTIEGERMLRRVGGLLDDVGAIVRSCHERWDGGGYPDGLAGTAIPQVSRIIACCDAYNAMVTDRPYRQAMTRSEAIIELLENRGTQFDPIVVDTLVDFLADDPVALASASSGERAGLLQCVQCGSHTMVDVPVPGDHRVCLRCGLVPMPSAG
jgi:HD-GYP domain-containing protein (c-di-GMP phosphodiesterase class II)